MPPVKTVFLPILLLAIVATAGCSSRRAAQPAASPQAPPAAANPSAAQAVPTVTKRSGKVASVNVELRFAVVDFSPGGVPPEGRTMSVYRGGQKVAEVKISSPVIVGSNTAADIVAGNVQVGDLVQDD